MRQLSKHLSVALLILAISGFAAFGKDKTRSATVTFSDDITVGGTLVKAGEYKVKFDETTNEVTMKKGSKVVAKATGTLQPRADKARATTYATKDNQLISIAFGGDREDVVLGAGTSTSGS
ncbi:MAG TPA: hypothetical protein VGN86_06760 [Pyrinomonadaceae bacterium]|jgi:hypothetical protein|nr:hypothetical protein [Pyrinomonadaceae bacterium]